MTTVATVAGSVAAAMLIVIAAFQLSLALGAPLGGAAWGGTHRGRLPRHLRIGSAAAGIVLLLAALVIAAKAGLMGWSPLPDGGLGVAVWAIVAMMALNTLGNVASASSFERHVFAPVTAVLAVLAAIVGAGGSGPS